MDKIEISFRRETLCLFSILILLTVVSLYGVWTTGSTTGLFISEMNLGDVDIAACPTFWYLLEDLEGEDIEIYYTQSTGNNIQGIMAGEIDAFISGRALHPEEPNLNREVLGPGFSFISQESKEVFTKDLDEHQFYTDRDAGEVINNFDVITQDNLKNVENIYSHLDNGIGITSIENTDYSRSEVVHVLDEHGSRHRYSRTPSLYYTDELEDENIEHIVRLLEE